MKKKNLSFNVTFKGVPEKYVENVATMLVDDLMPYTRRVKIDGVSIEVCDHKAKGKK